jgi:hypothetical protein
MFLNLEQTQGARLETITLGTNQRKRIFQTMSVTERGNIFNLAYLQFQLFEIPGVMNQSISIDKDTTPMRGQQQALEVGIVHMANFPRHIPPAKMIKGLRPP